MQRYASIRALGALCLVLSMSQSAAAEPNADRFTAAGYLRIMTRPDFQGGDSKLGFSNFYGRLLNEGPYAGLELRLNLSPRVAGSNEVWSLVHARVEGGSAGAADLGNGTLDNYRVSQLYVQAGNVLLSDVTWQLGTINTFFGDLGLYDFRLAELFAGTVGLSARYQKGPIDLLVGAGDAGFSIRGRQYSTILTTGATARLSLGNHVQLGLGAQAFYEPKVEGNRFAPHNTPGVSYENFVRGEIATRFLEENPGMGEFFPDPVPTDSASFKAIGYFGFGGLGPLRWSSLYANLLRRHPGNFVTESTADDGDFDIYTKSLTDERYQLNIGNEMLFTLIPNRLDAVWSVFFARHWDKDNQIKPSDDDRTIYSTVGRLQLYLSRTVHLLGESSLAREKSTNGNAFRNNFDSVFQSTNGISDSRGLEFGDSDTRDTVQGKIGVVLNPQGFGIYTRPSLRILYGVQHSTQNNAFGNNFVETLEQFDDFEARQSHVHHVVALEAEAWF